LPSAQKFRLSITLPLAGAVPPFVGYMATPRAVNWQSRALVSPRKRLMLSLSSLQAADRDGSVGDGPVESVLVGQILIDASVGEMPPMKSALACPCAPRRFLRSLGCLVIFLCPFAGLTAGAKCISPESMRTSLHANPGAETYANLGSWFGSKKQFVCAAEAFAAAARLQPESPSLAYMWGLSLYSAGKEQESLAPLRLSERLNADDIKPHLLLAAALDKLDQPGDAETEWRAALALAPDSQTALEGLSQDLLIDEDYPSVIVLLGGPAVSSQRSAVQSLNLGLAYARTARLEEAAKVLREGLNTFPDFLPIAHELSVVLVLLGRPHEATTVLELALDRHPRDLKTQILYLRTLIADHSPKALEFGRKLLLTSPHNSETLYLNGLIELREGQLQQARDYLQRSVALKSDDAKTEGALGLALMQLQEMRGAREHLARAVELGDSDLEVRYDLAKVLRSLGENEQAQQQLALYQQMKKAQSDRTQAAGKAETADQALASGNPEQAVSLYREALASDPGEALLAYKLALALDKVNDPVNEKAALEQALKLNPNLAEAQNQMGYLATRAGDLAQAESFFRAAIHASPSYGVAWLNLAATLASESRWQDAKQALARALEIDPDNVKAQKLSHVLNASALQP
jgi:Flp pilus assembly protein TadD